jgi:AraC-like DNA-binding protein
MRFGTGGAFDYAVASASSLREAVGVASRYSKLLTDSFHVSLETWGDRAVIRLDDEIAVPTAAADFAMSAMHKLYIAEHVPASRLACWFPYAAPKDLDDHQRVFGGATLKFSAPAFAFAFPREYADMSLPGADPVLHALLKGRVESLLGRLSESQTVAAVVRRLIGEEIVHGDPTAERVARALHMSRRTMTRRLERERTTFNAELDAVRCDLATRHVLDGKLQLTELAFLLGFAHVESFHRAFKRWTGETPVGYRASRSASAGPS